MAQEITGTPHQEATPTPEPTSGGGVFRTRIVPLIALVLVIAMIALLAYSLFAPEDSRLGANGRINSSGALITENGRTAPDFALDLFDGGEFNLADQRGKIVVVNFWASWCEPCQDETPLLTAAVPQLDDDVVLIGINVWDQQDEAQKFADYYDVNYPVAMDSGGTVAVDYGLTGVPETFVIDAQGKIIARLPGPITNIQQLRDMIAAAR